MQTFSTTIATFYIQGKRQEVLMTFLSADVYINPKKQTLSEAEWDVRKRIIFLKSSFLNSANRETSMTSMEMVCVVVVI